MTNKYDYTESASCSVFVTWLCCVSERRGVACRVHRHPGEGGGGGCCTQSALREGLLDLIQHIPKQRRLIAFSINGHRLSRLEVTENIKLDAVFHINHEDLNSVHSQFWPADRHGDPGWTCCTWRHRSRSFPQLLQDKIEEKKSTAGLRARVARSKYSLPLHHAIWVYHHRNKGEHGVYFKD